MWVRSADSGDRCHAAKLQFDADRKDRSASEPRRQHCTSCSSIEKAAPMAGERADQLERWIEDRRAQFGRRGPNLQPFFDFEDADRDTMC